jgi:putative ABC transport system permease protein
MTLLRHDLRYALRSLRQNPGFSLIAIAALALGIGANTAIFSVVNSLLLRPLPYRDPGRLTQVWQSMPGEDHVNLSSREFQEWSKRTEVFDDFSAYTGSGFTLTGHGDAEMILGQRATASLFRLLGVNAALGRTFAPDEDAPERDHVVVLSHGLWASKFSSDPKILGQDLNLNNESYRVIGVMPEGFEFPARQYKLWVPVAMNRGFFAKNPDAHFFRALARLKPGITRERVRAELDSLPQWLALPPGANRRFQQGSLEEQVSGGVRRPLLVLMIAVGFVLLIACANVASLMLARATARQREMAIRAALGAGRGRLIAQTLTESVLLAVLGGALGLMLAVWGVDALIALSPKEIARMEHVHIDAWVLCFTAVASVLTGLLFGLAPAIAGSRREWGDALKQSGKSSASGGFMRLRGVLVFAEIALSMVLLIGAGLMLRSFVLLEQVNPGFRPDHVFTAVASLQEARYPDAPSMVRFTRTMLDRVRSLPGADAAGITTHLPFSGQDWGNGYEVEGHPAPAGQDYIAQARGVSPGYFRAIGIPLRAGRDLDEHDVEHSAQAIVVNEAVAKRFWPNHPADALGQRINVDGPWRTVVGVVGNVKHLKLDQEPGPELYIPYAQMSAGALNVVGRGITFVIHSSADTAALASGLRVAVKELDPDMPLTEASTLDRLIDQSVGQQRFRTWLIAMFSALALVLASVGVYGTMSYAVTRRAREIGIRMALGAQGGDVLRMVLLNALGVTLAGIAAGTLAALALTRGLATLLYGIGPRDPLIFTSVPALLAAVALLASWVPARRAARVDPMMSLREE